MNTATPTAVLTPVANLDAEIFNKQIALYEGLISNISLSITWVGILFSIIFVLIFGLLGFTVYIVIDSRRAQKEAKEEIRKIRQVSAWAEKQRSGINNVVKEANKLFKDFQGLVKNGQIKLTKEQENKILKRIEKVENSSRDVAWPNNTVFPATLNSNPSPSLIDEYTIPVGTSSPSLYVGSNPNIQSVGEPVNLSKLLENIDKLKGTVSEYSIGTGKEKNNN